MVIITIETGNDTMKADNLAKVTLKICPRNFSCCQTNVLDNPKLDDYTNNKSNFSGYFNKKEHLGKCYFDTFKVMDKNFIKSVEMSYKPTSKKNKDTWTPKEVKICFMNGKTSFIKGHIYQCDKLENLGPFGPGQTTKDLINCKWHKGTCFRSIPESTETETESSKPAITKPSDIKPDSNETKTESTETNPDQNETKPESSETETESSETETESSDKSKFNFVLCDLFEENKIKEGNEVNFPSNISNCNNPIMSCIWT